MILRGAFSILLMSKVVMDVQTESGTKVSLNLLNQLTGVYLSIFWPTDRTYTDGVCNRDGTMKVVSMKAHTPEAKFTHRIVE
jgi:hypothetical protein